MNLNITKTNAIPLSRWSIDMLPETKQIVDALDIMQTGEVIRIENQNPPLKNLASWCKTAAKRFPTREYKVAERNKDCYVERIK